MGITDSTGFPVAMRPESASSANVELVEATIEQRIVGQVPQRLIGDRAYKSDYLDEHLSEHYFAEFIAPKHKTQSTAACPPKMAGHCVATADGVKGNLFACCLTSGDGPSAKNTMLRTSKVFAAGCHRHPPQAFMR